MRPLYLLAVTFAAGTLASLNACTINGGTSAPPAVPPPAPMPDVNAAPIATPPPATTVTPVVTAPPATTTTPVVVAPPATTTVTPVVTAPPATTKPLPGGTVVVAPPATTRPPVTGTIGQHPIPPVPPTNGACSTDADCRIFSDYCTGCDCRVLARSQANPTCKTKGVQCLVDPCRDAKPVCQAGACTSVSKSASTQ